MQTILLLLCAGVSALLAGDQLATGETISGTSIAVAGLGFLTAACWQIIRKL